MRLSHIAAVLTALAAPAAAETVEDRQMWINVTAIGVVKGSDLAWFAEVQPRFVGDAARTGTLILRGAAGWRVSPAFTGYLGYARVISPVEDGRDRAEDRLFLQASWTLGDLAGGTLSSRTRLEHRRLSTGRDTGWRLREFVRWVRPLGSPKRARALLSVEPFVAFNDTDWGARGGFDQVRTFAGVEVPVGGRSTVEVGYLNQLVDAPGRVTRMNHVASLALFLRP